MKILFVPPLNFPLVVGGFQYQVRNIFNSLHELNIDVSWYNLSETNLSDYDIIHIHSTLPELLSVARRAKQFGKKVVLTPMIGSRAHSNTFYSNCIKLSRIPGVLPDIRISNSLIRMSDFVIPLVRFEYDRLHSVFGIPYERMKIIPNGMDDGFFETKESDVEIPFKDYLLTIGRIEPNKNQLSLIRAARKLGKRVIIVGEAGNGHSDYEKQCRKEADENVMFWGKEFDKSVLRKLYKNAALTVIQSYSEILPLVTFESLSQKTPVLCTNQCGFYPEKYNGVFYTSPDEKSLEKNIMVAINANSRETINRDGIFTWNDIAQQHIDIYRQLLNDQAT